MHNNFFQNDTDTSVNGNNNYINNEMDVNVNMDNLQQKQYNMPNGCSGNVKERVINRTFVHEVPQDCFFMIEK